MNYFLQVMLTSNVFLYRSLSVGFILNFSDKFQCAVASVFFLIFSGLGGKQWFPSGPVSLRITVSGRTSSLITLIQVHLYDSQPRQGEGDAERLRGDLQIPQIRPPAVLRPCSGRAQAY